MAYDCSRQAVFKIIYVVFLQILYKFVTSMWANQLLNVYFTQYLGCWYGGSYGHTVWLEADIICILSFNFILLKGSIIISFVNRNFIRSLFCCVGYYSWNAGHILQSQELDCIACSLCAVPFVCRWNLLRITIVASRVSFGAFEGKIEQYSIQWVCIKSHTNGACVAYQNQD